MSCCWPWSSKAKETFSSSSKDKDSLLEQRPQRACRRPPIIEKSDESSSNEEEEDAAPHIHRAARRRVQAAQHHHQQGAERTVHATQCPQYMKELADEVGLWVSDANRQLKRFAASPKQEVIADCPVDNATMDEFEQWLGLFFVVVPTLVFFRVTA